MTNYLPHIFAISSLLLGIYLFLIYFEIYSPKKAIKENKEKSENFKLLMKTISVILILKGGYDLINPNPDRYKISKNSTSESWNPTDRQILVEKCIKESGQNGIENPKIIREYCECSMDNIMQGLTKKEYLDNLQKPQEEQIKVQMPLFEKCFEIMSKKIDSLNKNGR